MIFYDKINKLTDGKYSFIKVSKVLISVARASVTLELLVPYEMLDKTFCDKEKQEVFSAIRTLIPMNLELAIDYKKSFADKEHVATWAYEFFATSYVAVPHDGVRFDVKISDGQVDIDVQCKKICYDFIKSADIQGEMSKFMARKFTNKLNVRVSCLNEDMDFDEEIGEVREETVIRRRVITEDNERLIGKGISIQPPYIADHKSNEDNAVYCGKIEEITERFSKKTGNPYYTIVISDTTGRLICKGFAKSIENEYKQLVVGDEIIVQGKLNEDSFLHDTVLLVSSLSRCRINYKSIVLKEEYKREPAKYSVVHPYRYEDAAQTDMFSDNKIAECPKSIAGQSYVVFDLETTGLDKQTDMIIEIGAVKVVDGVITECFSSFVNPERMLSEEIISLTGITQYDVNDAPTIEEVLPDFYKFTRGSALVAHNAAFDTGFIYRFAAEQKYLFDNKVKDTLALAKGKIIAKNYKLGTLCEAVGISLEGAHRAVNDCEATAKLFIHIARLSDYI